LTPALRLGRRGWLLSGLALTLLAGVAFTGWHADLWLRAQARTRLEALLARIVQGEVHIDRVANLWGGGIVAEGVTVLDPARRPVLHAQRLSLGLNLYALYGGTLHFTHGRLSEVRIHAIPSASAAITLFDALSPAAEEAGENQTSSSWPSVLFDHIHVERARVYGGVPGLAGLSARLEARGKIRIDDELHVAVTAVQGNLSAPYPTPLALERATLALHTGPLRLALRAQVAQDTDHVGVRLNYSAPARGDDALSLILQLSPVSADLLLNLGVSAAQVLVPALHGELRLFGPTRELGYHATLESAAGRAKLSGKLPEAGGVDLRFASERLLVGELIAYAPPIELALSVRAEAGPGEHVRIHADAPTLDVFGHPLSAAHVSGYYEGERFYFKDGRVNYAGGHFDLNGWVDNDADLYVRVRANVPQVARDPSVRETGLEAALRGDFYVARAAHELSFEGELSTERLRYKELEAGTLALNGEISIRDDLAEPRLRLRAHGSEVAIAGFALGDVELRAQGARGDYDSELATKTPEGRAASMKLRLEQREERYRFVASDFALSVAGRDGWRGRADVTLAPEGVEIDALDLQSGPQHLSMRGTFSYEKRYKVNADLHQFDLGGLRELTGVDLADLDGTVDGQVALFGVPDHPQIEASGKLRNGVFLGMRDLELDLTLKFDDGRFELDTDLRLPDASTIAVFVNGEPGAGETWLEQIERGRYEFGLKFREVPFAVSKPWLAWLNLEPPPGKISAELSGFGTLREPRLSLTTRVDGLVLGDAPALDIDLSLDHDGTELALHRLRVADGHGELLTALGSISASMPELFDLQALRASLHTRPFELNLETPRRRLDELPAPLQLPWPIPAVVKARLTQTAQGPALELDSLLGFPSAGSGVSACDGTLRRPELALHLQTRGDEASGSLSLALDGAQLGSGKLDADVPLAAWLSGEQPVALPRTGFELSVETLASEDVPILCQFVAGPLRLDARARDAFALPPNLHVALRSSALQLAPHELQRQRLGNLRNVRTLGLPFAFEAQVDIEGGRAAFQASIDEGAQGSLLLTGTVPGAAFAPHAERDEASPPIDVELRAQQLELAPLTAALPLPVRTAGRLSGSARVRYDLIEQRFALSGALALSQGTAGIAPLGQQLSDIAGRFALHDNTIEIERLAMRDFDGTASVSGDLRLVTAEQLSADLELKLSDFSVRSEGVQVSKLTGRLGLRALVEPDKTRAELVVKELRVNLPSDLGLGLQELDAHPSIVVAGERRQPAPETPYLLELRVLAQDPPFRVLRADLSAEVQADVTARYANPDLSLWGNVALRRGSFELYGKRFELQESRISFDRDDHLDPLVSLYATRNLGRDEIGVRVEGRLSDPKVSFSHSNPAITDTSAIIAELLGARNTDPTRQSRDASGAAAGVLAGATAGLLTEQVRRDFGGAVPVLSMDSQTNSLRSTRIRAGVQLDQVIEKRLGRLRKVVHGAYVEGFVAPGATSTNTVNPNAPPQSRGGGLLELRFPRDLVGSVEYRPPQNWRVDMAWEP
jgi:TamB, inner membrane protein subunit of TAM complex